MAFAARRLEAQIDLDLRERHFEDALVEGFNATADAAWSSATRQGSVRPTGWHGRLGPVDIVLNDALDAPLRFVEVKWGGSELWNCAWDLAKLAVCTSEGLVPAGLLVAGATAKDWHNRVRGAELFERRRWEPRTFLDRFARDFAFWRGDVQTRPLQLPSEWETLEVAEVATDMGGEDWRLRATLVVASDARPLRLAYVPEVVTWGRAGGSSPRLTAGGHSSSSATPDAFSVTAGSGLGPSFEVRWADSALLYEIDLRDAVPSSEGRAVPSAAEWHTFWVRLDRLDIWAWSRRYEPDAFSTDGYEWTVHIAIGGRHCQSSGYMAFPGADPFDEGSAVWDAFVLALSDLLGGASLP